MARRFCALACKSWCVRCVMCHLAQRVCFMAVINLIKVINLHLTWVAWSAVRPVRAWKLMHRQLSSQAGDHDSTLEAAIISIMHLPSTPWERETSGWVQQPGMTLPTTGARTREFASRGCTRLHLFRSKSEHFAWITHTAHSLCSGVNKSELKICL